MKYSKQQKKVGQRILSIGLHVEISDRFFSLVLVHWSSLDPELCLIFRDIHEYT